MTKKETPKEWNDRISSSERLILDRMWGKAKETSDRNKMVRKLITRNSRLDSIEDRLDKIESILKALATAAKKAHEEVKLSKVYDD